mmetsp:Transcript_44598/g.117853  ORF Transcript_44598/g.117853 Transcript_44598/m.117853 type:complete len:214 (+) Transcript_44598:1125-1766(+)
MHHGPRVAVLEGREDLAHDVRRLPLVQLVGALLHDLVEELAAVDELHDKVDGLVVLEGLQEPADGRVVQPPEDGDLAADKVHGLQVALPDLLHGADDGRRLAEPGLVHGPEAALPHDLLLHLVDVRELLPLVAEEHALAHHGAGAAEQDLGLGRGNHRVAGEGSRVPGVSRRVCVAVSPVAAPHRGRGQGQRLPGPGQRPAGQRQLRRHGLVA